MHKLCVCVTQVFTFRMGSIKGKEVRVLVDDGRAWSNRDLIPFLKKLKLKIILPCHARHRSAPRVLTAVTGISRQLPHYHDWRHTGGPCRPTVRNAVHILNSDVGPRAGPRVPLCRDPSDPGPLASFPWARPRLRPPSPRPPRSALCLAPSRLAACYLHSNDSNRAYTQHTACGVLP
jgi:hypothetical protein